ncbi:MAG: NAD-dependent epimerase/dehydratase family protein [Bryobacteraceae bacterium]
MKTLVIGGTLFIGRALVKALRAAGHDVTVLHRKRSHRLGRGVGNLQADRNDPAAVRAAIGSRRFDAVFDNVYDWEHGTTAEQVAGTARACGDSLTRYIFISSVAAYGDGLDHSERDALAPADHPDRYVRNKAESERALFRMHRRQGLPAVTLRPPYVYGPENPFYREQFFWDRLRAGRPIIIPGDGRRLMQFVYVHDIVAACMAALTTPGAAGQAFNIAEPAAITQLQAVRAFAAAADIEPRLVRVPRRIIAAAGGQVMQPPLYFGFYYDMPPITMSTRKARRVLGFQATPFAEGLAETYRWRLRNHTLPPVEFHFEDSLLARGKDVKS